MDNHSIQKPLMAGRESSRRAMSLLELITVITIVGMLSLGSVSLFGHKSLLKGNAAGFARKVVLSLVHARRSTIATGDNHYLQMTSSGGNITSFSLFRRDVGGDVQVDETRNVPAGLTVTSTSSTLEFDFEGAALNGYTVTVVGPDHVWLITITAVTGHVRMIDGPP